MVPSSLASLLELIVPRLQQRSGVRNISPEDQQNFVSTIGTIIMCLQAHGLTCTRGHIVVHSFSYTYTLYICITLCMSLQVSILVGELSSQFCDIKQQINDPFLVRTVPTCSYMYCECVLNVHVHAFVLFTIRVHRRTEPYTGQCVIV